MQLMQNRVRERLAAGAVVTGVIVFTGSPVVVALIEDAASLRDFDALAAMSGIDAYFVGPTDLSIALGVPGATFDEPTLAAALDKVVVSTRKHGKTAMTLIGNSSTWTTADASPNEGRR